MKKAVIGSVDAVKALGLQHKFLRSSAIHSPLALFVHGRAGSFESMWTFKRCIPEHFHILALQAPLRDPYGGFSWWPIVENRSRQDYWNDANQAAKLLSTSYESALDFYQIKPRYGVAYGFSQGAGLLSTIAQQSQAHFAGIALLAGFVVRNDQAKPPSQSPKIFIGHGTADERIGLESAKRGRDYLESLSFEVSFHTDDVGHKVGSSTVRALKNWTYAFESHSLSL